MVQERVPPLAISTEWAGRVATVTVRGEIDMSTVGVLAERLVRLIARHPSRLIIDLAGVGFLDSTAVHAFVQTRHALPAERPVVLRSPQRQARRLFEQARLDKVCVIELRRARIAGLAGGATWT